MRDGVEQPRDGEQRVLLRKRVRERRWRRDAPPQRVGGRGQLGGQRRSGLIRHRWPFSRCSRRAAAALGPWEPVADVFVGNDIAYANDSLVASVLRGQLGPAS